MDEYLIEMKEIVDLLDDAGIPLPENVVVWYTLKTLPKEYDILKQMILCDSLPTYHKLELRLLSKEMSKKVQRSEEKDGVELITSFNPPLQT